MADDRCGDRGKIEARTVDAIQRSHRGVGIDRQSVDHVAVDELVEPGELDVAVVIR